MPKVLNAIVPGYEPEKTVKTVLHLPEDLVRKMAKVCKRSESRGNIDEVYAKFIGLALELWENKASTDEFWES